MADIDSKFWSVYPQVVDHRRMIAQTPVIKHYYEQPANQDPIRAFFKAAAEVPAESELAEATVDARL
eukprot:SAG22_NODE_350_length_11853_cov_3.693211_11_plen_67_part_00